jgi:hypothetical protein
MATLRITASKMFAQEMARACVGIITGFVVCRHLSISMEMGESDQRAVSVSLQRDGDEHKYHLVGSIVREDGVWVRGECTVHYGTNRETYWKFTYDHRGDRPVTTLTETTAEVLVHHPPQ